jgi:RNA polymerase primary sigma factor
MSPRYQSELGLVAAVMSGDSGAAGYFLEIVGPTVWSVVRKLEGTGPEGQSAFLGIVSGLKTDGYARLKEFDGRANLLTYVALVARDILSERLARRLIENPSETWAAFERFFSADIRWRVAQRFPFDEALRDDVYQDVCLKLVENDFSRIRSYDGRGSFIGYVLTIVERILIDCLRREVPRRRLPAAVARLSLLDQEIYIAVVWENCPPDAIRLATALRGRLERALDPSEIRCAIERLAAVARLEPAVASRPTAAIALDALKGSEGLAIADQSPDPEEHLLLAEEERSRAELLAAVKLAAAGLPPEERRYLQTIFSATDPLPPREVARIMGCRVEEVYRLRQRAQRWFAEVASQLEKSPVCPSISRSGDSDHGTASAQEN